MSYKSTYGKGLILPASAFECSSIQFIVLCVYLNAVLFGDDKQQQYLRSKAVGIFLFIFLIRCFANSLKSKFK